MKKTYFSILALSLLLALLTACGAQAKQPDEPTPAPQAAQTEPSQPEASAEPAPQDPEPIADIQPIAEPEPIAAVEPEPEPAPENPLTFTDCNETVYATSSVNLRGGPGTEYDKVGSLSTGNSVTRTGIGTGDYSSWSQVQLADGSIVYVSSNYISTTKPSTQQTSGGTTQNKTNNGGTTTSTSTPSGGGTQSSTPSGGSSDEGQQWAAERGQGLSRLHNYLNENQGSEDLGEGIEHDTSIRVNMN